MYKFDNHSQPVLNIYLFFVKTRLISKFQKKMGNSLLDLGNNLYVLFIITYSGWNLNFESGFENFFVVMAEDNKYKHFWAKDLRKYLDICLEANLLLLNFNFTNIIW